MQNLKSRRRPNTLEGDRAKPCYFRKGNLPAYHKLRSSVPSVSSVVKKRDEILGMKGAKAYCDRLEKAHSDRYEIRMRE